MKHCHSIENIKILGRECEKEVFATAIRKHIENKLIVYKNRTIVFE
jgi:formyltetrahydrofolate hydrolase